MTRFARFPLSMMTAVAIAASVAPLAAQSADSTLDRAVALAFESARPGDTVLLAPACASFDQFENYEHRGRVFKQLVRALASHAAPAAVRRN